MQASWYTGCLPVRLFLAVGACWSWFSYLYIVVAISMVASFLVENKPVKLVHATCWGMAYFGGIPALIVLVIDTAISVLQFGYIPTETEPEPVEETVEIEVSVVDTM